MRLLPILCDEVKIVDSVTKVLQLHGHSFSTTISAFTSLSIAQQSIVSDWTHPPSLLPTTEDDVATSEVWFNFIARSLAGLNFFILHQTSNSPCWFLLAVQWFAISKDGRHSMDVATHYWVTTQPLQMLCRSRRPHPRAGSMHRAHADHWVQVCCLFLIQPRKVLLFLWRRILQRRHHRGLLGLA